MDTRVYAYTVHWIEKTIPYRIKSKVFSLKREAKQFAKKIKKDCSTKSFIITSIVNRDYFRADVAVEYVDKKASRN